MIQIKWFQMNQRLSNFQIYFRQTKKSSEQMEKIQKFREDFAKI
jgi:hypothetical protein